MAIAFQGESAAYRAARNALLSAERDLRRQTEAVAQLRRELPQGHQVAEDYRFESVVDGSICERPLSSLFEYPERSLVVYSFMFAEGDAPCPMCNAFLDAFDGVAQHVGEQLNLAIVAKADPQTLAEWQRGRGWQHLKLYSHRSSSYARDYFSESPDGAQLPMLNMFEQTAQGIHHSYTTELFFEPTEPGQHPRHMDAFMPLWKLFDLTGEGRPANWMPSVR